MERRAFVYLDKPTRPVLVGRMWSRSRRGRETATFEYDAAWLASHERFALEPALTLAPGPFQVGAEKGLLGAIGDSAPDRWGRTLMRRAERHRAQREGRAPRTFYEIDFLLMVDDEVRTGALRFADEEGGPFLAEPGIGPRVPPLVALPGLLAAAERVAADTDDDEDLRLLIAPGSSLGGARPKASVTDRDRHLAIAKFPHRLDDADAVLWEALTLSLAGKAGIVVPAWRIETVAGKAVLLVRRFDRRQGARVPFLSAMSMLGARPDQDHSYLEIADALRRHGAKPNEDLGQLWRRIVFNILVSNTDDHLLNHGFLYEGQGGWRLSPAYDMNPVPVDVKPRVLSTAIEPGDPSASLELALANAEYFGVGRAEAGAVVAEIGRATGLWRKTGQTLGLSTAEIDRMASAFEHEDAERARAGAA
jgi:serine/threonine-protein kinase HipA